MKNYLKYLLALALVFPAISQVEALDTSGPRASVEATIEKARAMVNKDGVDTTSASFRSEFEQVIFDLFDFKEMARRSLGKNWKTASEEEQSKFVDLFSQLLSKTYMNRVINGFPNSTVEYGEEKVSSKKASLKTKVMAEGENINVNYRLKKGGEDWKVYDIVIENVSLVSNYRGEFAGIVRKEKVKGLIVRLQEKLSKPERS